MLGCMLEYIAWAELLLCWIVWMLAFIKPSRQAAGQKKTERAPASRWGIAFDLCRICPGVGLHPAGGLSSARRRIDRLHDSWPRVRGAGWAAAHHLGKQWRYEAALSEDHELIQTGVYRWLRHPIYASMLGMFVATGLAWSWWPKFLVGLVFFIHRNRDPHRRRRAPAHRAASPATPSTASAPGRTSRSCDERELPGNRSFCSPPRLRLLRAGAPCLTKAESRLSCPTSSPSTKAPPAPAPSSSIATGAIAAVAQKEFQQFYPQAGWVEHDPMEILTSQMACAVEALGKAGARPRDVAAIGITNQRETTIVWERATGKPIYPAIVWQDRRTAPLCDELEAERRGRRHLGQDRAWSSIRTSPPPSSSGSSITSTARDAMADRGELAFGTVDSWLIWHLTSGQRHVTDVTNASRTMLYNVVKGSWDERLATNSSAFRRACYRKWSGPAST